MRLDTVDTRSSQSDVRTSHQDNNSGQSLLTPARREALEALEREFLKLVNSPSR